MVHISVINQRSPRILFRVYPLQRKNDRLELYRLNLQNMSGQGINYTCNQEDNEPIKN